MPRTRVLNCITGLNVGGAEYMLVRFLKAMGKKRFDPSILSLLSPGALGGHVTALDIPLTTVGMAQSRPTVAALFKLRQRFLGENPDVVHGWMYHGNVAASLGSIMGRRQPVIWSVHHSIDSIRNENRMTQWLLRCSALLSKSTAAITYCSKTSAEQHERLGFDPSKSIVIPNGIDCDVFQPDGRAGTMLRSLLGIPNDRLIIGNVARAHPMKDHENLVRASDILLKEGLNIHLLIVGAGHESGGARNTAVKLGILDRVSFLGPRDDVHALVAGLDIYASSSAWGEAFPLAVSEAMSCGVPSLATNLGDCLHLIGNADMIVPPRDPKALASVLGKIARLSQQERRSLGLSARERVVNNFSLSQYVRHYSVLYERLAAQ